MDGPLATLLVHYPSGGGRSHLLFCKALPLLPPSRCAGENLASHLHPDTSALERRIVYPDLPLLDRLHNQYLLATPPRRSTRHR